MNFSGADILLATKQVRTNKRELNQNSGEKYFALSWRCYLIFFWAYCWVWKSKGPLHDPVTLYKITYTGESVAQWDFQNNAPTFVLEVPLRNATVTGSVQRAYFSLDERLL